jgi:hypothetical protein
VLPWWLLVGALEVSGISRESYHLREEQQPCSGNPARRKVSANALTAARTVSAMRRLRIARTTPYNDPSCT